MILIHSNVVEPCLKDIEWTRDTGREMRECAAHTITACGRPLHSYDKTAEVIICRG